MSLRITWAGLLMLALLGGCQTREEQEACLPPDYIVVGISPYTNPVLYFTYMAGCKAAKAVNSSIEDNGWNLVPQTLRGRIENNQYRSADDVFSVTLPGPPGGTGRDGYDVNDRYLPHEDLVFFSINDPTMPGYAIRVTPLLDRAYAALSMTEYADLAMQDSRMQAQRHGGALQLINNQRLQLDGKPALFRVYMQSLPANRPGMPSTLYYLVYFIKQGDRAAVLTAVWPRACPRCRQGSEQDIRSMDQGLDTFVSSFDMGTSG